ncbi:MAG: hypothetical protein MI810_25335 [Flavobacteriales bacterium]|nr:hypothetical protein [Flavobacteriales bacterium]
MKRHLQDVFNDQNKSISGETLYGRVFKNDLNILEKRLEKGNELCREEV